MKERSRGRSSARISYSRWRGSPKRETLQKRKGATRRDKAAEQTQIKSKLPRQTCVGVCVCVHSANANPEAKNAVWTRRESGSGSHVEGEMRKCMCTYSKGPAKQESHYQTPERRPRRKRSREGGQHTRRRPVLVSLNGTVRHSWPILVVRQAHRWCVQRDGGRREEAVVRVL